MEAVVCAPPDSEFAALLDRAGAPLARAFMPVREFVDLARRSEWDLPRCAVEMVSAQFKAIAAAAKGCDAILATGLFPSIAAAQCIAEKLGIHYIWVAYCPQVLPSQHHRPMAYPGHPLPPDVTDNRVLWRLNAEAMNALFGQAINAHRASIDLPTVNNIRDYVFTDHPWLASDPVLSPWRPTDLCDTVQTGAWILPDERPLSRELEAFLNAGEPPVYVGFGSMAMPSAKYAGRAAIAATRAQGRRVVVSQGWAELGLFDERDDCFGIGEVNQQALFRRVAAVVHHGGAGTTMTAARAGAPQVIVPRVADQPYWGGRVAALGIGAAPDGPDPTFESLSNALRTALTPETRARAISMADATRPNGAMMAAKLLLEGVRRE